MIRKPILQGRLNTDRVSVESCVAQIQQLAGRPEFEETEESRAMLADLALNAHIRAALKDHDATSNTNITIESHGGKVVLSGIVVNAQESAEAAWIASTVEGVASVDSQLRLMAITRRFASAKY